MSNPFEGGPPLLTDLIESGLQALDKSTQATPSDPRIDMLKAELPELFERALLRVKPQLMEEFQTLVEEFLKKR